MRNSSSPLPDRLRVVNPLKINAPHQQQNCCGKKVTHSCWVWCIPLPWPFTCRAQPFTQGERFYPEWRREHELMVPRRLVWKREGETSSPKTKKEVLIQCRLLSRLSQQASSNWGCPCPSQSAVPLDSTKVQRCTASGQLLFEGNEQLHFLLYFFYFGYKFSILCICRQRTHLNKKSCILQCCTIHFTSLLRPLSSHTNYNCLFECKWWRRDQQIHISSILEGYNLWVGR